ncbi:MAG: 4-alpha-glucanotransferase [Dehalococcoidia bacterium]|nr:4-alpha-glucanotransferase [Dehalococcoidia bacterium]
MSPRPQTEPALLRRLARLYGVQTSYIGMDAASVEARPESLLAALRGLGAPIETSRDLRPAIRERVLSRWDWHLEPVLIAWEGALPPVELRLPERERQGEVEWRLELEGGEQRKGHGRLEALTEISRRKIAGESHVALALPVEGETPLGYHALTIEVAGRTLTSRLIAAPRRAHAPAIEKQWGVFLPLYALHSKRGSIGDLTELQGLVEWASKQGAGFVGTLPLLASFLEEPFDPSPYAPVSRLFWNELYIDAGEAGAPPDRDGLVDYRQAMARKRAVLEAEARAFFEGATSRRADFEAYLQERPEAEDYARFRAAIERLGPNWREWPSRQRAGGLALGDYDEAVARYYAYAQWRVDAQMQATGAKSRAAGTGLYLDLPVGVHALGYDAWRYQELFASGMSVGAPPDIVTTSGQNWGFAPLSPEALRRSGHEHVQAYLRHHLSVAGMLRVDHAMGLHRLYWIPRGGGAADGVYVRYPAEELYAVHTLESQRNQAVIAGENLGIVPVRVNDGLAEHAIARMYVMMIELRTDESLPFRTPPRGVVASFGTHDLPPFAAFWQGSDIDKRVGLGVLDAERAELEKQERQKQKAALVAYMRRRGLIEEDAGLEEVFRGLLAVLAGSRAERVMVNLEDLWLEDESQNMPGTLDHQHPNWRRRARYSLEEMQELSQVRQALTTLTSLRPRVDAEARKPRLSEGIEAREARA